VDAVCGALGEANVVAGRPSVLICRTSTRHGLDCLPPDADGHFIKVPPELARAAEAELTGKLAALHA
jgi:transketolase